MNPVVLLDENELMGPEPHAHPHPHPHPKRLAMLQAFLFNRIWLAFAGVVAMFGMPQIAAGTLVRRSAACQQVSSWSQASRGDMPPIWPQISKSF
jgi:hypothetical protein